jgi:hypothetical protein
MIEFIIIAAVILVLFSPVVMNTIGPFIVWKTQKIPVIVRFPAMESSDFIKSRNEEFLNYDLDLKKMKFDVLGSSLLEDLHTKSYFRLYWNPSIKLAAMAVTMTSKSKEITFLEFTQRYKDETVLNVNNSVQPEAYPKIAFKQMLRFPKIRSAELLLEYHSILKSKIKAKNDPVEFDLANGFFEVEKHIKREADALLEMGLVKNEIDENGKRSLTLKGAFIMTFRSVSPGKEIFGFLSKRQAMKLISNE